MDGEFETEYLIEDGENSFDGGEESPSKNDSSDEQNQDKSVVIMFYDEAANNDKQRKYAKRSGVWEYFKHVTNDSAICCMCNKVFRIAGGVSNLRKHLLRHHNLDTSQQLTRGTKSPVKTLPRQSPVKTVPRQSPIKTVIKETPAPPVAKIVMASPSETVCSGRQRSTVWSQYEIIENGIARCKICGRTFVAKSTSTSNLKKHYSRCVTVNGGRVTPTDVEAPLSMKRNTAQRDGALMRFTKIHENTYVCGKCGTTFLCERAQNLVYHVCEEPPSDDLIWNYFEERPPGVALCLLCRNEIEYSVTYQLVTHLKSKHKNEAEHYCRKAGLAETIEKKMQRELYSSENNDEDSLKKTGSYILKYILDKKLPFSLLSDKYFLDFVAKLTTDPVPEQRYLTDSYIPDSHADKVAKIKSVFEQVSNICLSVDVWGSRSVHISLTAHFVDSNFVKRSVLMKTLSFATFPSHDILRRCFVDVLEYWQVQIDFAVCDDQRITDIFDSFEWPGYCCYLSELRRCLQVILGPFKGTIDKVRTSFYNSKSVVFRRKLNTCFSVVKFFAELPDSAKFACIDGELLKELCLILKPFQDVCAKLQSEKYIEASIPIVMTSSLLIMCEKHLALVKNSSVISALNSCINHLKATLRVCESNDTLGLATFLDPRFKTHCFRDASVASCVKDRVENMIKHTSEPNEICDTSNKRISVFDTIDDLLKMASSENEKHKQEVDMYIKDRLLDAESCPATWWQERAAIYPNLSGIFVRQFHMIANCRPCCDYLSGSVIDARLLVRRKYVDSVLFLSENEF